MSMSYVQWSADQSNDRRTAELGPSHLWPPATVCPKQTVRVRPCIQLGMDFQHNISQTSRTRFNETSAGCDAEFSDGGGLQLIAT